MGVHAAACTLPRLTPPAAAAAQAMPSALTFAKRAECYLKLKQPNAAIRDADAALALNADSAKAYKAVRVRRSRALCVRRGPCLVRCGPLTCALRARMHQRGTAHRLLGSWEAAAKDLGTAQNIDFDDAVAAPLKLVVEKAGIVRKRRVEAENAEKQRCVVAVRAPELRRR